jgi:hypothetical protein
VCGDDGVEVVERSRCGGGRLHVGDEIRGYGVSRHAWLQLSRQTGFGP